MEKTSHHKHHQLTAETNRSKATDSQSVEFIKHVHELRSRIFWVAMLFMVASALAYQFREILVDLVLSPLGDQKLIYLTPAGGFSFIFQITMYAGAVVASPVLVYQLYKFVVPALPTRARKHTATVFLSALILMCGGVAFGYFVAIPAALSFLTTFAGDYVNASLTADSYLGFVIAYVAGLGLIFQLPLLLIFWHWIKPLTPAQLLNSERFILVFAFIAAAVITPTPDVVNQLIIAAPIVVIYQIGVVSILLMIRSARRRARRAGRLNVPNNSVTQTSQTLNLPSLALPTMSDLAPRRPAVAARAHMHKSIAPVVIAKKSTTAVATSAVLPAAPLHGGQVQKVTPVRTALVHTPSPAIVQRPTLSQVVHSRQMGRGIVSRPRPTISARPAPQLARPRMASLDGFVVSSQIS